MRIEFTWRTPSIHYAGRVLRGMELAHAEAAGQDDVIAIKCGMACGSCCAFYTMTGWGEPWHAPDCKLVRNFMGRFRWFCHRCAEAQAEKCDAICHACRMEQGKGPKFYGGTSFRRTGGWADVHEHDEGGRLER